MTIEYLEVLSDMKKNEENHVKKPVTQALPTSERRKLVESFKSNTRRYDDGSIEIAPQEKGEPSQKDVKKVGKSKRYSTTGKSPLMCIELKCPNDVTDKAAFFRKELAKLTKDIQISEPEMPEGEFLIDKPGLKVWLAQQKGKVSVWLTFETKGLLEIRRELYSLTSEIDKCLVINETLVCPQR